MSTPGGVQYSGGYHEYRGDAIGMMSVEGYHEYSGSVQYTGGYHEYTGRDTMMSVEDIMSTQGDVQYPGVSIQIQLFSKDLPPHLS